MKMTIKYLSALIVVVVLMFTSCEKWIDPEINIDPDSPADVPMYLLLPSIQARLAYVMGGRDVAGTTNMWVQIYQGKGRQALLESQYRLVDADVGNMWSSMYSGALMDCVQLVNKADEENSPAWKGAAQVMMALTLKMGVDLFGPVPYSEALSGSENYTPKFDSETEVYTAIQGLLTDALTNFAATNDVPLSSSGDMIYGGDTDQWIMATNAMLAKVALTQSELNGYGSAKTYAQAAMTANADNFSFAFDENNPDAYNPMYQFDDERNDIVMCKTFIDALEAANDPRLPQLAWKLDGVYKGLAPGVGGSGGESPIGPFLGGVKDQLGAGQPVKFATAAEMQFIIAEVDAGTDLTGAKTALKAAVALSLSEMGVTDATWKTAYDATVDAMATENEVMTEIMYQKWIAMAGTYEPFNDWRRLGNDYLNLGLAANAVLGTSFPQIYPYPTAEKVYNRENVPDRVDISERVWWDVADNVPAK
jgi:hypothetical protein